MERVRIYRINNIADIDFYSLLFELKEINHNLNTSKLKEIELYLNNKIIDIDPFNKYLIEFKHNKWNMEYKFGIIFLNKL